MLKPDRPTLLAWSLTVILLGASAAGAWMMSGKNVDGLLALLERLEYRSEFRPLATALIFGAIYALTTALTLPTATILSVAAGYLFGMLTGFLISMAGAMSGAMITFLGVRFAAGERIRGFLLRGRTYRLVHLLERNAFFYLIALRVVPVAPFFVINAAGAMIRISARRFALGTALGLAPILLVYASVGAGLETLIQSGRTGGPEMLLRPRILLPLLALAAALLLGMLGRLIFLRRRRRLGEESAE